MSVLLEVQIHSFNELQMHAMTQMGFWELCHLRFVAEELQAFRLASNSLAVSGPAVTGGGGKSTGWGWGGSAALKARLMTVGL